MGKTAIDAPSFKGFRLPPGPEHLTIIGLDTTDGPEHKLYDKRVLYPVDEATVLSIMGGKINQAIVVRKSGDKLEVIDGRQRVRACREANRRLAEKGLPATKEVPIMPVFSGTDTDAAALSVLLNNVRQDDSPHLKAEKAKNLRSYGMSEEDVAMHLGMSLASFSQHMKLFDCDQTVQDVVAAGEMSLTTAIQLAPLSRPEQAKTVTELVERAKTEEAAAVVSGEKPKKKSGKGKLVTGNDVKVAMGKSVGPSKRLLKKLRATDGWNDLDENFVLGVRWLLGEVDHGRVKGLIALVREVGADKSSDAE